MNAKRHVLFIQGGGEGAFEEDRHLAASLQSALGSSYAVHYPRMPEDEDAPYADWKRQIAAELATLEGPVVLVGHSVGGSILLKYLAEEHIDKQIAGVFVIAAPFFGGDGWEYEDLLLPRDVAAKLSDISPIAFYHSRDDEIVPFAHLGLYAEKVPQATIHPSDGHGHQFGRDLSPVAADIVRAAWHSSFY